MPRTAATLTQADVARTIRAAKQAGAAEVVVRPDGTMIVHLHATEPLTGVNLEQTVEVREIVL